MSYETVRSAYRLWASDDAVETYMAIGIVSLLLAPTVFRWWRSSRGEGSRADNSKAEVRQ